jgi:hypothetical protein
MVSSYTLDTKTLGNITGERHKSNRDWNIQTMPMGGTNEVMAWDFGGSRRDIEIEGTYVDTLANIQTFIGYLQYWKDGKNYSGTAATHLDFASVLTNETINVVVTDIDWEWSAGQVNKINYRIKMVEMSG